MHPAGCKRTIQETLPATFNIMKNYSLEIESENIHFSKTKEYFKEVLSSFHNQNYRASIVTLYSVVVVDILLKLESLKDIYQDSLAENILNEIKASQAAKPNSGDWESELIEKVKDRTQILDIPDYANVKALQQIRHLCAHPVIDSNDKLFTPNRDAARGHIRNILESILCHPPLFTQRIFEELIQDISNKKDLFPEKPELERYITAKYLNNCPTKVKIDIFKKLWKFTFRLNNNDADQNRKMNSMVLEIVYKQNFQECNDDIISSSSYYSNIEYGDPCHFLISFLAKNDHIYTHLDDNAKVIIERQIEDDVDSKCLAWFLSDSFQKHLESIKEIIKAARQDYSLNSPRLNYLDRLFELGKGLNMNSEVNSFIIWYFGSAHSFTVADNLFSWFIYDRLQLFTKEEMLELLSKTESNSQIYERKAAYEDHSEIKVACEERFDDEINLTDYPKTFSKKKSW